MKKKDEEEYEYSLASEDALRIYDVPPNHPFFERSYGIELQIAFIEGHMPTMFPSDKKRALKTIKFLKNCLKGVEKYGPAYN